MAALSWLMAATASATAYKWMCVLSNSSHLKSQTSFPDAYVLSSTAKVRPVPSVPLPSQFRSPVLVGIGARYGVSPYQVVLRWIVQQNATFVVGTGNPLHMVADTRLFDFEVSSH